MKLSELELNLVLKRLHPPLESLTVLLVLKPTISSALSSKCVKQGLSDCHLPHQQANNAASVSTIHT